MGKEDWKETGKALGGAFEGLAKSLFRSAKDGIEQVADWADGDDNAEEANTQESNVFNDGTWRETGKNLGHAMRDLGKSILNTTAEVAENVDEWAEKKEEESTEENND